MTNTSKVCETCRFWNRTTEERTGQCRLFPPVATRARNPDPSKIAFEPWAWLNHVPITDASWWCGKWREA